MPMKCIAQVAVPRAREPAAREMRRWLAWVDERAMPLSWRLITEPDTAISSDRPTRSGS